MLRKCQCHGDSIYLRPVKINEGQCLLARAKGHPWNPFRCTRLPLRSASSNARIPALSRQHVEPGSEGEKVDFGIIESNNKTK